MRWLIWVAKTLLLQWRLRVGEQREWPSTDRPRVQNSHLHARQRRGRGIARWRGERHYLKRHGAQVRAPQVAGAVILVDAHLVVVHDRADLSTDQVAERRRLQRSYVRHVLQERIRIAGRVGRTQTRPRALRRRILRIRRRVADEAERDSAA